MPSARVLKMLFKLEEFENAGFSFPCGRKTFGKHTFYWENDVFLKRKSKLTGDCDVFRFFRCSADTKHLMRFLRETTFFKFLLRSVEAPCECMLAVCNYYMNSFVSANHSLPVGPAVDIFNNH